MTSSNLNIRRRARLQIPGSRQTVVRPATSTNRGSTARAVPSSTVSFEPSAWGSASSIFSQLAIHYSFFRTEQQVCTTCSSENFLKMADSDKKPALTAAQQVNSPTTQKEPRHTQFTKIHCPLRYGISDHSQLMLVLIENGHNHG
jgi:hypothetical protein